MPPTARFPHSPIPGCVIINGEQTKKPAGEGMHGVPCLHRAAQAPHSALPPGSGTVCQEPGKSDASGMETAPFLQGFSQRRVSSTRLVSLCF